MSRPSRSWKFARRGWSFTRCAGVSLASLALVVGVVGLCSGVAAAGTSGGPARASGGPAWVFGGPTARWTASVKGTVAASPAPTSSGFTLDVPGCSTPQAITTPSTTYSYQPATGTTPTGVQAGEKVIVALEPNTSTLTARWVTILLASITGTVDTLSPLVVTDPQGFMRTINVSGTTTYAPPGSTVAPGDSIAAFGTVDPDHVSLDALVIFVRPAPTTTPPSPPNRGGLSGVVAASPVPTSSGFTLDEPNGTTQAVATDSTTKYLESGATTPPSGVAPGEHVFVALVSGASTPTAAVVFIVLNQLDGTVVSTASSSFVISDHQGFWRTIDVSDTTHYAPSGTSLDTLTSGEHVVAFGTVDPDGTDLDAQFVHVLPTPAVNAWYLQAWAAAPSTCPTIPPSAAAFAPGPFSAHPQSGSGAVSASHAGVPDSGSGVGTQNPGQPGAYVDGHANNQGTSGTRPGPGGFGARGSPGGGGSGDSSGGSGGPGQGSVGPGGSSSFGDSSGRGGGPGGGQGFDGGFGGTGG